MQRSKKKLELFLNKLCNASGKVIRGYFRKKLDLERKEADSPVVTIADREAEQLLRKMITTKFPEDGIFGEEFGSEQEEADYQWVLDPIDGTIAFTCGKPLFGTLIGLWQGNKPLAGAIDIVALKERWVSVKRKETLFNGKPCATSNVKHLHKARLTITAPSMFNSLKKEAFHQALRKAVHVVSYGGDCCNYGYLAAGFLDVVIENGLKWHDYAALVPIVEGAGGIITDWQGTPLDSKSTGTVIACANRELWKQVMAITKNYLEA